MPVLDASVLVAYLAGGEDADEARAAILAGEPLLAPHLVDAEVGHVLRRAVRTKQLGASAAGRALVDLADLPLGRAAHRGLLDRAWALRSNVTFYDALYIALAEAVEMPLVTLDGRLAGAPGVQAQIHVIPAAS